MLEVTLSMMVIGILAAVAIPAYSNSILTYRIDVAAKRIAQDISFARRTALQTNSNRTITFDATNKNYSISGLSSLDRTSAPYLVALSQSPYQVGIALTTSALPTASVPAPTTTQPASVALTFNRFGMPDKIVLISVSSGSLQKIIDVAASSGKVSVQ